MLRCPFCGVQGRVRLDKKEHPFWRCPCCMVMIFFKSELSESGFMMMQRFIEKSPAKYRNLILQYLIKRQKEELRTGATGA